VQKHQNVKTKVKEILTMRTEKRDQSWAKPMSVLLKEQKEQLADLNSEVTNYRNEIRMLEEILVSTSGTGPGFDEAKRDLEFNKERLREAEIDYAYCFKNMKELQDSVNEQKKKA
jgi:nitrate reductase assembly molybdenum cofactor insertion protein NarJ